MNKLKFCLWLQIFAILAIGGVSFAQEFDRDALKAELREELKAELKKELFSEIKEEMKTELLSETKANVQEVTLGLKDVMKSDFKAELRAEIMEETKSDLTAEVAKALGDAPILGGMFKGTTVGGFLDTNFSYNFASRGRPVGGSTPLNENNADINHLNFVGERENNSFTLESFAMFLDNEVTEEDPIGWQLHTYWGEKAKRITFYGEGGGNNNPNATNPNGSDDTARNDLFTIAVGNITWKAPVFGKHVDITMGKFYTWIGYELVENIANPNYSHSMIYNNAIPFTHSGLSFDVSEFLPSDKWGLKLYYVNGWDSFIDNNRSKSGGAYITYKPNDDFFISLGMIAGDEGWNKRAGGSAADNFVSTNNGGMTAMYDIVATYSLPQVDKLSLGFNFDNGYVADFIAHDINGNGVIDSGQNGTPNEGLSGAHWWGMAEYFMYDFTDSQQGALRYTYFDDSEAARGFGATFWDITYTQNMKVRENLLLRPEIRYIKRNSSKDTLPTTGSTGGTTNNEFIFTFGTEYVF